MTTFVELRSAVPRMGSSASKQDLSGSAYSITASDCDPNQTQLQKAPDTATQSAADGRNPLSFEWAKGKATSYASGAQ
eukprot:6143489-Amphidinium_carterae.2